MLSKRTDERQRCCGDAQRDRQGDLDVAIELHRRDSGLAEIDAFRRNDVEARPPGSGYIVLRQGSQRDRYLWCNLSHWLFSLVQPKEQDLSIMATGPMLFEQPVDFSLVLGGPLFQLFRKAHLSGDAL